MTSSIQEPASSKPDLERSIFTVLVVIALTSIIINFQTALIVYAVLYAGLWIKRLRDNKLAMKLQGASLLFVLLLIAPIFYLLIFGASNMGEDSRLWELLLVPLVCVMAYDAIYQTVQRIGFNSKLAVKLGLCLIPLLFLIKLAWAYANGEITDISNIYSLENRRNAIVDVNPNHADDVFAFGILTLIWFLSICTVKSLWFRMLAGVGLIVHGAFFLLSGSLGGIAGFVSGTTIAVLALWLFSSAREIKRSHILSYIGVIILFTGALFAFQTERIFNIIANFSASTAKTQNTVQIVCQTMDEGVEISSLNQRFAVWKQGINLFSRSPLIGHGHAHNAQIANETGLNSCLFDHFAHVHSFYLDAAIRGGLVLVAYYLALGALILALLISPLRKPQTSLAAASIIAFLIYLMVQNLIDLSLVQAGLHKANLLNLSALLALTRWLALSQPNYPDGRP